MQQNMMGQNIIITEPSKNLRALGRNALIGKWKLAILATIVYELCLQVPPVVLNAIFGNKAELFGMQSGYYDVDVYSSMYNSMPSYSFLASLYTLLVTGAFALGITLFFLAIFRRQRVGVSDVFLGFEHFGKALGLMLFQTLFIALWALLFIVPGVIAAIRYSQSYFIMADDPTKGIRQCVNESKMMMKGNKSKYFCMTLSFIGWFLLAAIPSGIITSIPAALYAPVFVQSLIDVIASLFTVPVTVYMFSTEAGFYEILAGHLIKETEPAPVSPSDFGGVASYETSYETSYGNRAESESVQTPVQPAAPAAPVYPEQPAAPETPAQPFAPSEPTEQDIPTAQGTDSDDNDDFIPKEVQ